MNWWVTDALEAGGPALLVSWIVVVIGSITLHELAHGWSAIRLGDRTPIETGHMTWNPVVHLGTMSLVIFAVFGIAWGAMPIDPSRIRGRHGVALVTLAGPLMNVAIAVAAIICGAAWDTFASGSGSMTPNFIDNVSRFFWIAGVLNIALALFNLLPVFPLDGGRILAEYHRGYAGLIASENGQWIMIALFMLCFWFAGDIIFGAAFFVTELATGLLVGLLSTI